MMMMMAGGEASNFSKPRVVVKDFSPNEQPAGNGAALVRRSIGRPDQVKDLDPFLLLDYFSVSESGGFPDHPHRGFETITYMLEGALTHQDFFGCESTVRSGDLQWMTAGRGIVHNEMPAGGGWHRGLQLWVNLPSQHKLMEAAYEEVKEEGIAKAKGDGVKVAVIAGECLGVKSLAYTQTPIMFLDITFQPRASLHQPIPEGWNAFAYILEGDATLGSANAPAIGAHHMVVLSPGDGVSIWNNSELMICRVVLVGGQPLHEPILRNAFYVMNTEEEMKQAEDDFRHAKNGFENIASWKSDLVKVAQVHV